MAEAQPRPEEDRVALVALQALTATAWAGADRPVRVSFTFLDGRSYILDTGGDGELREVEGNVPPADAATQILCNGAGLIGLLTNTLGRDPSQIFLCRGERQPLLSLAAQVSHDGMGLLALRAQTRR